MTQAIEQKMFNRIQGKGRGWTFAPVDFSDLGRRSSIDVSLHRLLAKNRIRRVMRGVYDYPEQGKLFNRELSPDLDRVARALARKHGWRIQATGAAALNLMGLSTQVQGRIAYLSDGPTRRYSVGGQDLFFKHAALKETGFRYMESALVVQGLKTLGPERITPSVLSGMSHFLGESLKPRVLKDTQRVTGWIRDAILELCGEQD